MEGGFDYDALQGRVVFGAGRVMDVPAEVERLDGRRALVIGGHAQEEPVKRLEAMLGVACAGTIVGVRQHVPLDSAAAAREHAAELSADCLIAIGGGSAVGLAKAVALTERLPIIAVPTTYSGSEMTPIWGLTSDGEKTTGRDLAVLPRTVVYDPELTVGLPGAIVAASGMNAMAHCVEALWAAGANPLTSALAEDGIRMLAPALRRVVADVHDRDARDGALLGAWLAGAALAGAGTGLHHRICHVLGGLGLPHAEVHAAVLAHVAAFNAPAAPDSLERVARALGCADAVAGLAGLAHDLGASATLVELGLSAEGADLAADRVARTPPWNPRQVTRDDVRGILEDARLAVGRC